MKVSALNSPINLVNLCYRTLSAEFQPIRREEVHSIGEDGINVLVEDMTGSCAKHYVLFEWSVIAALQVMDKGNESFNEFLYSKKFEIQNIKNSIDNIAVFKMKI